MKSLHTRPRLSLGAVFTFCAATLVVGLDSVGFTIALATLMFSGALASGLSMGVTAAIASSAALTLIVGLLSRFKSNIAGIQDIGAAVLAVTLSTQLSDVAVGAKIPTAFAIIASATMATGLLFCLVGFLKVGRFARFFPLEVLAGFLAATGCVLLLGGVGMLAHVSADIWGLFSLQRADQIVAVILGLGLGVTIYGVLRFYRNPFALLTILISAASLFHIWRWTQGMSLTDAASRGFLPIVSNNGGIAFPFPEFLNVIDQAAVIAALPTIATVAVLSLLATLLNLSALEVATGTELNIDTELRATGIGNIVAAGAGGSPGYTNLSMTLLLKKLGFSSRSIIFGVVAILLLGLLFAPQILRLVPTFVTSALVFYFGIDLVKDWLIDTRKKFKLREWAVVLVIVIVSVLHGMMLAVLTGLVVATVLFVYSYAHTPIVRTETTLAKLPSTTDRSSEDAALLRNGATAVRVFQLQGFLFFGTSEQVLSRMRNAAKTDTSQKLQQVIMDFSRVTDMDSASAHTFKRILDLAESEKFSITFCGLSQDLTTTLSRAGVTRNGEAAANFVADLDLALIEAEEMLLAKTSEKALGRSLTTRFANSATEQQKLGLLFAQMRRTNHAAGSQIIAAGAEADRVFIIESGAAIVQRILPTGKPKRLRTMLPGAIVGDIAFSIGSTRTADVVAEIDTTTLSISAEEVDRLAQRQPDLAHLFNRLLARALAEKVIAANRMTEHAG